MYENLLHAYKNLKVNITGPTGSLGTHDFTGGSYKMSSLQVLGVRSTGWTAMTGAADKATTYAVGSVTLPQLAGRVKALQDALTTHGLIGA